MINAINEVEGVADVIRLDVNRKTGTNYSSTVFTKNLYTKKCYLGS
jgi:hypothetical protein